MTGVSPFAPTRFPEFEPVAGVRLAGAATGLKKAKGVHDLMLAEFAPGTTAAGVFTRSLCPSAPVDWCRRILAKGRPRGLVVNSGNANAFTGAAGLDAVRRTAEVTAGLVGAEPEGVYIASTGVIGETLGAEKITDALAGLYAAQKDDGWEDAARAIMTTDTYPKGATRQATVDGVTVTLNGFAKGSGMIAPDMATMLAFVFTDLLVDQSLLQDMLRLAVAGSFNAITVDSDTSTSDSVVLFATGHSSRPPVAGSADIAAHQEALGTVMLNLAQQIVRDGEGATKFISVSVAGATSNSSAKIVAKSIANSPLVKTAIAGEDANWGRVVMAIGKCGEAADPEKLVVSFGGQTITDNGMVCAGYDEAALAAHLRGSEIQLDIDLGVGDGRAVVWTCDLTHGYININADYRS